MNISFALRPVIGACAIILGMYPALSLSAPTSRFPVYSISTLATGLDGPGDAGYKSVEDDNVYLESSLEVAPLAAPPQPSQNTNYYRPPAGTVLYRARNACASLTTTTPVNVFSGDIDFTTGPASTVVEVNYSAQSSLAPSTVDNTLYVKCSVSQDAGSTWTTCSGQGSNGIAMNRGGYYGPGTYAITTNAGSYMGFVADLQPATATKLRLEAKLLVNSPSGTTASYVCQNNVIIRF